MISASNIVQVREVTWAGLIINLALFGIKFSWGVLGFSQALVADAFHSLSDLSTDIAVLLGVQFWSKPADEDHPYGHKRIETMITAFIGFALLAVAMNIGYKALMSVRDADIKQPGWIAFAGALVSVVVKEILYRWTVVVGKRVKSSAVIANAWHHRSDALSSIPVAIAVAAGALNPRWSFIDHVGAFVVSLFIFYAAGKIILDVLRELTDQGASKKIRARIETIALATGGVKSIHAVRTRRVGSDIYADLHVLVDGRMSVREGHDISEAVKRRLLEKGPQIADVVVHLEPFEG
ncbi:MAG: cation diffusion facilitator family transporter [Candidatus Omnitrophota bacterium]